MLNLYTLIKFLHVSGDIGIFIGISVQWLTLAALRRSKQVEQVRALAWLITRVGPLSAVSAILTIGTGIYLTLAVWGWQVGWTTVALISIILFMPPLGVIIEPRTRRIVEMVKDAPDGPLSATLDTRIHDPLLGTALQTQAAFVFGIVFLMTTKPGFGMALIVMAFALVLGLVSGIPHWVTERRGSKISL